MEDVTDGIRDAYAEMTVDIGDLVPYPGNPRRGHLAAIKQGLMRYGQYKPLVVQSSTMRVLVGNQTLQAAQQLGWARLAIVALDVDDEQAAKIVAADNRFNELGSYDGEALRQLLESLDDGPEGTGYSADDLEQLVKDLDALDQQRGGGFPLGPPAGPDPEEESEAPQAGDADVDASGMLYRLAVECDTRDEEDALLARFAGQGYPVTRIFARSARGEAKVPVRLKPDAYAPDEAVPDGAVIDQIPAALRPLSVSMGQLTPYPGNPRRGDVPAIAASLARYGQYRPIVARRHGKVGQILAGNHTYHAAKSLGWTQIAVAWIDADDDEAARIVAWDNRASDLGHTDDEALADLLTGLPSLSGTGYSRNELDLILQKLADAVPPLYGVVVDCSDEDDQVALIAEFGADPRYRVRAILS